MKYTVADLRLMKRMVNSANADDEVWLSESLHKRQPHFCNVIDEVGIDPRCSRAHLFCTLFCSLALDHAERVADEDFPSFPEKLVYNTACMIVQEHPEIGERGHTYRDRVERHVLNGLDFDDDDAAWLETMISAFLILIEKSSVCDGRRRQLP